MTRRVPVMEGMHCIELAGPARVRGMLGKPNVRVVRERGEIVEVQLLVHGDDTRRPARRGNAQRLCHDGETATNPAKVWEFKRVPR